MPLVYQQNINATTKLALWHITESEAFFTERVSVHRAIAHPHKRLQHLAGRWLLQALFPEFPYDQILIADTRRPFIQDEAYHFSISHSGDYAAVLVSTTQRTGVDVEVVGEKVKKVLHKFLHPEEMNLFTSLIEEHELPDIIFYTAAWSIKEALYKWNAEAEVEFSDQLRIRSLLWQDQFALANCEIVKADKVTPLKVEIYWRQDYCLSWVTA
jgi:phosphopantetheinyl transferase